MRENVQLPLREALKLLLIEWLIKYADVSAAKFTIDRYTVEMNLNKSINAE